MGKKSSNSKKKGVSPKKDDGKKPGERIRDAAGTKDSKKDMAEPKEMVAAKTKIAEKSITPAPKSSEKDLIMKQFEIWKPAEVYFPPVDEAYLKNFTAPPFFADESENQRIRLLLLKPIDLKVPVSLNDLIIKQFESWNPEHIFIPPPDEVYLKNFTAPPFFADESENRRVRTLLLNPIDLRVPVSLQELIVKQFEVWKPENIFIPPRDEAYLKNFTAPPFFADESENRRVRTLLLNPIDLRVPVSLQELIVKQFEVWKPENIFIPPQDEAYLKNFTAPLFFADESENQRIRTLLLNPIDLRVPVPIEELILKQFDWWKPTQIFVPPVDEVYQKNFSAPPFFTDESENQRIRALLQKTIDLTVEPEKITEPEKAVEPEKAPEPEKAEEIIKPPQPAPPPEKPVVKEEAPKVIVTYDDSKTQKKGSDPMDKTVKYLILGFAVLFALIIGASTLNSDKYYIKVTDSSVEIWKGVFAPMGKKLFVSLPGAKAEGLQDGPCTKDNALRLAVNYYVDQADAMLNVEGIPDFEKVKSCLKTALTYGTTDETRKPAYTRLSAIDLITYLYKADFAASKGSNSDFDAAAAILQKAAKLPNLTEPQMKLIEQKIILVKNLKESLSPGSVQPSAVPASPKNEGDATIQQQIESVLKQDVKK